MTECGKLEAEKRRFRVSHAEQAIGLCTRTLTHMPVVGVGEMCAAVA